MAFADLLDLQTAVIEHVGRPDIADVIPRLVKLAEVDMCRKFRLKDQVYTVTITPIDGVAPLPDDYLEMIGVYDSNRCEYIEQPLQPVSACNKFYSIDQSNIIAPGVDEDLTVQYYGKIPTITQVVTGTDPETGDDITEAGVTGSNWMLEKHPDVYLYAVSLEAAKYIRDPQLIEATNRLYREAQLEVHIHDERERYSRSRVRPTGVTP